MPIARVPMRLLRRMLVVAALLGGPTLAAGRTPPTPGLTPLGKLLLEEDVKRKPATGSASEAFITCAFPGGLCGAVGRDGKVVVAPQFDWVDDFVEERALVRLRGLYGFIDATGRVIVEPKYELARRFQRGYAQVVLGDKMGLVDREGKFVFEPAYGYIGVFGPETFKASTGRKVCGHIEDISVDGESLSRIFGECSIDPSAIDVRRLAGDDNASRAILTIISLGNPWPIIAAAGKIDILAERHAPQIRQKLGPQAPHRSTQSRQLFAFPDDPSVKALCCRGAAASAFDEVANHDQVDLSRVRED